jgi:hypothetical protein
MQFFLIDVGTAVAALLGYLALVAAKRRYAVTVSSRRRAPARAEPDFLR